MAEQDKLVISKDLAVLALLASFLPVFRCGLRENINFWEFLRQHTVFGSPVEYIPEEKYKLPENLGKVMPIQK